MRFSILLIILFYSFNTFSQEEKKQQKIHLDKANELEGGVYNGLKIRKLRGDVVFSQDGMKMYCDSAYQYVTTSDVEAFGKVKITQDKLIITGNHLKYNSGSKLAKMRGNVVMLSLIHI